MPSTRKVLNGHVSSLGKAVTTSNWSHSKTDQKGHASFPLFWRSYFSFLPSYHAENRNFIGLQREKLQALNCDWNEIQRLPWWSLEWDILRVKAIFVCKGDSFAKSVLSSKRPKSSTLSLIITPSDKYIKIRSNLVWNIEMFKNLHSVNCQYIERLNCHLLISIQTLHISTTVLHTKILCYACVIKNGGGVVP